MINFGLLTYVHMNILVLEEPQNMATLYTLLKNLGNHYLRSQVLSS